MRRPSRLTSTICGPPLSSPPVGCGARETIPPSRAEPVSWGWNGSPTSYCRNSPVPQPDRGGEVLQRDHRVDEAVGLVGVVGRPQLEGDLLLRAQVQGLDMAPG